MAGRFYIKRGVKSTIPGEEKLPEEEKKEQPRSPALLKDATHKKVEYLLSKRSLRDVDVYVLIKEFFKEFLQAPYEFTFEELEAELHKVYIPQAVKGRLLTLLKNFSTIEYRDELVPHEKLRGVLEEFRSITDALIEKDAEEKKGVFAKLFGSKKPAVPVLKQEQVPAAASPLPAQPMATPPPTVKERKPVVAVAKPPVWNEDEGVSKAVRGAVAGRKKHDGWAIDDEDHTNANARLVESKVHNLPWEEEQEMKVKKPKAQVPASWTDDDRPPTPHGEEKEKPVTPAQAVFRGAVEEKDPFGQQQQAPASEEPPRQAPVQEEPVVVQGEGFAPDTQQQPFAEETVLQGQGFPPGAQQQSAEETVLQGQVPLSEAQQPLDLAALAEQLDEIIKDDYVVESSYVQDMSVPGVADDLQELVSAADRLIVEGDVEEAKNAYKELLGRYNELADDEKHAYFEDVNRLFEQLRER